MRIYGDKWIPNQPLLKKKSAPRLHVSSRVSCLIDPETAQWRRNLILESFAPGEAKSIMSILIGRDRVKIGLFGTMRKLVYILPRVAIEGL